MARGKPQNPSTQAKLEASRASCASNPWLARRSPSRFHQSPKRAILAHHLAHRAILGRHAAPTEPAEIGLDTGEIEDGRGGFRTCDLSRVKRALSH
jgi:hypothetical protein